MGNHSFLSTESCKTQKLNKTHKTQKCEKSSTFKPANAVTKSVPNSGKSSPTNTESTQPEPTMATPISSSSESTSTTTKKKANSTRKKVTKKLKFSLKIKLVCLGFVHDKPNLKKSILVLRLKKTSSIVIFLLIN